MDFTLHPIHNKTITAFALALIIPLAFFGLYVTYADLVTAKLSLYNAGIETTPLWRTNKAKFYFGQTSNGQWIAVEGKLIIRGKDAESACIESQRIWVAY
ncbi:MAG: hypothetical protein Q7U16_04540 [Agitococcus sp.]|nr:hypothetical protein [Agitococcus sp.]